MYQKDNLKSQSDCGHDETVSCAQKIAPYSLPSVGRLGAPSLYWRGCTPCLRFFACLSELSLFQRRLAPPRGRRAKHGYPLCGLRFATSPTLLNLCLLPQASR